MPVNAWPGLAAPASNPTRLNPRADAGSVWLTQGEIAELFQTTKQNVSLHAKNIFADSELVADTAVKESLTGQTDGGREVKRRLTLYNLDLILAIGYRVRSPRGTQFLTCPQLPYHGQGGSPWVEGHCIGASMSLSSRRQLAITSRACGNAMKQ